MVIELGGLVFEFTHDLVGDLFRAKNAGVTRGAFDSSSPSSLVTTARARGSLVRLLRLFPPLSLRAPTLCPLPRTGGRRGWLGHAAARGRWGLCEGVVAHPGRTPGIASLRACASVPYGVASHGAGSKMPNVSATVAFPRCG
jgi:hypothetical protein